MSALADTLLKKQDVAALLNVSLRTVERLVRRKALAAVVISARTVRFRPADVERAKARLAGDVKPGGWLNA